LQLETLFLKFKSRISTRIGLDNWIQFNLVLFIFFLAGFHLTFWPKVAELSKILFCLTSLVTLVLYDFSEWIKIFKPRLVLINLLAQICLCGLNIVLEYSSLNFNFYDSGWFFNPIANFANGYGFFNSEIGQSEFADHFCPSLILLTPFYLIFPNPVILPVIKFFSYIISTFFLFRFCRILKLDNNYTSFVLFLWSINIGVVNYMGFEFQASNLVIPFILIILICLERNNLLAAYLFGFLSCGFKETAGFALVSIGLIDFLYNENKKRGLVFSSVFFTFSILSIKVLMPLFSGNSQGVNDGIFDPMCCLTEKSNFIFYFLSTVGFLFVFHPKAILIVLPALATSLLGNRPGSHTLAYHYQDMAMVISFALIVKILSINKKWVSSDIFRNVDLRVFAYVLILVVFWVNTRSFFEFVQTNKPNDKTLLAISQMEKFASDYKELHTNDACKIWTQTCLAFYLSGQKNIKCIMNTNETIMDANPNYVILCDDATGRWPIDADYEQLKVLMRSDVTKGVRIEHMGYAPLIVFERK
jgi:uncharacterized membrane protein